MKKFVIIGLFSAVYFGSINLNAQKMENKVTESGKIIEYAQNGSVKMIINKDKVDRFKSIEVNEDYITWNYLFVNYDWPTIQFIVATYRNNEVNISSKSEVERIVCVYQKSIETLYTTSIKKPQPEDRDDAPLTTDIPDEE